MRADKFELNAFTYLFEWVKNVCLVPTCQTRSLRINPIELDLNLNEFETTMAIDNLFFYAACCGDQSQHDSSANMIMGEDFIAVSQRIILKSEIIHLKFTFASSARKLEQIRFRKCLKLVDFIYVCELRIQRGNNDECDRLRKEHIGAKKLFDGNSRIKVSIDDADILKIVECVIHVVLGSYIVGMVVDKVEIVRDFPEHILCFDYVKKVFLFSSDPAICGRNKYLEGKLIEILSHFVKNGKSLVHTSGHCPNIEDHFPNVGVVEILTPSRFNHSRC